MGAGPRKVHWDAGVGVAVCGIISPPALTTERLHVTCGNCRNDELFRYGVLEDHTRRRLTTLEAQLILVRRRLTELEKGKR